MNKHMSIEKHDVKELCAAAIARTLNSSPPCFFAKIAIILTFSLSSLLVGCGGDGNKAASNLEISDLKIEIPTTNISIPDNRFSNRYKIVMFGNSHIISQAHYITMLIKLGNADADVHVLNAGGGFLDNPSMVQRRTDMLASEPWTHVILQGQKYSQSGIATYPTIAAQMWIAKAKNAGSTPILFPEHPQRGKEKEGARVHELHVGIAAKQKSCVAPVGLVWDKVLITMPDLILHQDDGNHASLMGSFLTALVFYEVITGEFADLLPFIADIPIDESTQQLLGQLTSETIQANQACAFQ